MAVSEDSSTRNATYASSGFETATETTEVPQSDLDADLFDESDDEAPAVIVSNGEEDEFVVGPVVGPLIEETMSAEKDDDANDDDEAPEIKAPRSRRRSRRRKLQQ